VNSGTGTADAIAATTPYPLPSGGGDALIALPIAADTTSSPVTVSFNGGDPLTIKTASGNDVVAGGLKAGMIVGGYVSGFSFRLLSDQASAAIQSAAEAAQDAAETAAAGISVRTFASVDDAEVATIASTIDNLLVAGRNYVRVTEDYQLLGLEQIENGGFDTDSGWTKGAGWTIADGVATRTNTGSSSNTSQAATIDVEAGTAYFVAFDITAIASGSVSFFLGGNGAGANRSSIGSYSEVIVATTTVTATFIMSGSSTFAGSIDNVSVKALPADAFQSADGAWWGPVGASIERVDDETVYKVADRTALKALDRSKHLVAYLMEDGREGIFKWSTSNLSTLVAADGAEGIYVAPGSDSTGASGAWVRQGTWFVEGVDIRWFGAKLDGTIDDAAAWQGALDLLAITGGGRINFFGKTVIGTGLTYTNTTAGDGTISIVGLTEDGAQMWFTGTGDCLNFTLGLNASARGNSLYLKNFLISSRSGRTSGGSAIYVTHGAQSPIKVAPTNVFENIHIIQEGGTFFDYGIRTNSCVDQYFVQCYIMQQGTDATANVFLDFDATNGTFGTYFSHCSVNGGLSNIKQRGRLESCSFVDCSIVGGDRAIDFDTGDTDGAQLSIKGGHINAKVTSIYAAYWRAITITGVDVYSGVGTGDALGENIRILHAQHVAITGNKIEIGAPSIARSGIYLGDVQNFSITGNVLDNISSSGIIVTENGSTQGVICGNTILGWKDAAANDNGVYIAGTVVGNGFVITGNMIDYFATPVSASAPNSLVTGNVATGCTNTYSVAGVGSIKANNIG
jgi:hypothetical protein